MKSNKTQRQNRASGFLAMRPRGREHMHRGITAVDHLKPHDPFLHVFPIAEPRPIVQIHTKRGGDPVAVIATTTIPDGKGNTVRVPVCLHSCSHINMRHTAGAS